MACFFQDASKNGIEGGFIYKFPELNIEQLLLIRPFWILSRGIFLFYFSFRSCPTSVIRFQPFIND